MSNTRSSLRPKPPLSVMPLPKDNRHFKLFILLFTSIELNRMPTLTFLNVFTFPVIYQLPTMNNEDFALTTFPPIFPFLQSQCSRIIILGTVNIQCFHYIMRQIVTVQLCCSYYISFLHYYSFSLELIITSFFSLLGFLETGYQFIPKFSEKCRSPSSTFRHIRQSYRFHHFGPVLPGPLQAPALIGLPPVPVAQLLSWILPHHHPEDSLSVLFSLFPVSSNFIFCWFTSFVRTRPPVAP